MVIIEQHLENLPLTFPPTDEQSGFDQDDIAVGRLLT